MSQTDDSENHIWEYKSLGKKKKRRQESPSTATTVTKRRCTTRKTDNTASTVKGTKPVKTPAGCPNGDGPSGLETHSQTSGPCHVNGTVQTRDPAEGSSSGDYCPVCQMPFSALMVQTPRWHVAECLNSPRDTCTECPDGLRCSSTVPNHYRNFNHTLLAHCRANGDSAFVGLTQQPGPSGLTDLPGQISTEEDVSVLRTSQDGAGGGVSPTAGTPPSKRTNVLLCLRSPGPEDLKKKKGWSPIVKAHRSVTSSQESKARLSSTPVKEDGKGRDCSSKTTEPPLENSEYISYSPLSEFPSETEVGNDECRKSLFKSPDNQDEDSLTLFSDGFSSEDELLSQFLDKMENRSGTGEGVLTSNVQVEPLTSSAPAHQPAAQNRGEREVGVKGDDSASFRSPQSAVLERLRETVLTSGDPAVDRLGPAPSETSPIQRPSTSVPRQRSQSKGGQASSLKQTDIGVFFGLKPLKEKEQEAEGGPGRASTAPTPAFGENPRRREGPRRGRADGTQEAPEGTAPAGGDGDGAGGARGGWKRGGNRGWRRRGARVNADGEVEYPRCPFYKKIPGTKFVIDAFNYGEIEGISAYFLTHFHSDHYGGLTKNSTVPIYCNSITGNLVKSKLKVAEQHVHILPMNTQVTVDGVKVILLDANHCPGAAMLLFSLPDGQKVLHTGDFRADPSMETYPELLSCRVQTLYLDTTYCSPEYTFPKQQDAINFAANTAFEQVTLNPRTLVVCGSYSVGKEKVFLALAEVLGSKVCLSRDKYNTMCCLESEPIKQRITTDWKAAQVHVLSMMQLSVDKLKQHLARFSQRYDQLVAFKPTGWTFSQEAESVEDIQPQISGNISIYGIPYSEHSSFLELKRFVQWIKPIKIIPTVNNGSWASRKAMEETFREWLTEAKGKL